MQLALPFKPFDPKALKQRRKAAVQFLGMALFRDRVHGAKLASRVLGGYAHADDQGCIEPNGKLARPEKNPMNARNRIFVILGVLFLISLGWYFFTANRSEDLQLIGTIDANEVIVSSRIAGRIQKLTVDEGDTVQAGQLIATIQSDDLAAARNAAEATATSQHYLLQQARDTERQLGGSTANQVVNAEAQMYAAQATLAQAQAQLEHQNADTSRTVALAAQGVLSQQSRDEQVTSLDAAKAAVDTAKQNVAAAAAALKVAQANTARRRHKPKPYPQRTARCRTHRRLLNQAQVELEYAQVPRRYPAKINVRRHARARSSPPEHLSSP